MFIALFHLHFRQLATIRRFQGIRYLFNLFVISLIISTTGCGTKQQTAPPVVSPSGPPTLEITTLLSGYEIIWGMDFLPDGSLLFGEKRGKLYRFLNGNAVEITGFPR